MGDLKNYYHNIVVPKLKEKFEYSNIHQVPKLIKISINLGLGLEAQNQTFLKKAIEELRIITGQHPVLSIAKKSISSFKIRKGVPLGLYVTLRKEKMYSFLLKLIKLVFPRIRDFNGLETTSFDSFGNYNFGIIDQLVFPEIEYDSINKKHGFNINIVTSSKTNQECFFLLKELGFPFKK